MSNYPEPLEASDILFELDGWMILSTDKLAGFRKQLSVVGHECPQFTDRDRGDAGPIQFLDEEDSLIGVCWWCRVEIPEEIQTLWRLQNMDAIPEMNQYNEAQYQNTNAPGTTIAQKRDIKRVETHAGSKLKQYGRVFLLDKEYRDE